MKKWLSQAKSADTRMFVIIYTLLVLLSAYFVAVLFPSSGIQKLLRAGGETAASVLKVSVAAGGVIGAIIMIFVTVYLYFLLYYIVAAATKQVTTRPTNKLVKRSFYISNLISATISSLITIVGMLIVQKQPTSQAFSLVVGLIELGIALGLIYGFFKYLVKQPKMGLWIVSISGILRLIMILISVFVHF